ncbi:MAG: hypothetical protein A2V86_12535 [Deltaproteobacteria bacterium RBG_16_49_23]|nr:MAG: hypothetical protein A2V86_12535 [Deltaproteobacteria bacterium RBG_16_49_23]
MFKLKEMEKSLQSFQKFFLLKMIPLLVALFFLYGCAGVKPDEKSTPPVEEKVEQSKKKEVSSPQPAPDPPKKQVYVPASPPVLESPKTTPSTQPPPSPPPSLRSIKILWDSVNLREGPGTNFKVIGNVKQGTSLIILEEKGNWLRVRVRDGNEAWVSKAATSEASKPPPVETPKPKPM